MDNNGFSYDIAHPEPACQHLTVRPPTITKQRREIARVTRMLRARRIIMGTRVGEAIAAAIAPFVNVESEKAGVRIRQARNIRDYQRPSAPGKEPNRPGKLRIPLPALDTGGG